MRDAIRVAVGICYVVMVLMTAGVAEARTGRRVALVVGNAAYTLGPLANPVNDAAAVARALEQQLKFDKVLLRKNLSADAFRAALKELAWEARGAEVGLVFFAGHGIERGGRNYLIPTDAALAGAADIKLEAIALDTVLDHLDGVANLRLVILDACGPNPFPAGSLGRRGLGRIEPDIGTLVAYAAKDGTLATDGAGGHSPFTQALLKRIATPGLDVRRVLSYVRQDVSAATGGRQVPWHYGALGGDEVSLNPLPGGAPPPTRPTPADIAQAWAAVKDSTSVDVLEAFRRQYGRFDEVYDRLAMDRVHSKYASVSPQARAPAPLMAAEERGLKPKDTFKECNECPEMVMVPPGSYVRDAIRIVVGICCAIMVLMAAGVAEAQTGRRVALVVGNAAYNLGPLANPVNDAAAVAGALEQQLKFDKVLLRKNLSADAFRAALKELAWEARGAEVGLVFFAGHGIERGGRNYLIPRTRRWPERPTSSWRRLRSIRCSITSTVSPISGW